MNSSGLGTEGNMSENDFPCGYAGKFLRVDLTTGSMTEERWEGEKLRKWVGGTGVGIKILYDEVPPSVQWDDPENRLIMASGPFGGTTIMGTGCFSIVTKGALTNGATSTQANGYMGAYMKFAGYDAVIFQGRSPKWVFLYLHDGVAELRDAAYLLGADAYEEEEMITEELGKNRRQLSIFGIGPAGENLARFAVIVGDEGHVASKNGCGAVMGSKRVKAIVAERGEHRFPIYDKVMLSEMVKVVAEEIQKDPYSKTISELGTMNFVPSGPKGGTLAVKNYTTNVFPDAWRFSRLEYQQEWDLKRTPCWACRSRHLHEVTIRGGKYDGYKTDEPEHEQWVAWGPVIGNTDVTLAAVLSNTVDRVGLDNNEAGWVVAWVMECYEKGILTREELDGLDMTWGNAEAARELLWKIGRREGIGDFLAEGVKVASQKLGRGSEGLGIYTMKGNTPRDHDHRGQTLEQFDTIISDSGTISVGSFCHPEEHGVSLPYQFYNWEWVADSIGKFNGRLNFDDSLPICRFTSRVTMGRLGEILEAVTGWKNFDKKEAVAVGLRIAHLMRMFNMRCGIGPELEKPSKRYGSTPVDGPNAGKTIMPHLEDMRRLYYEIMGWDFETGWPLPETLKAYGLEDTIQDIGS